MDDRLRRLLSQLVSPEFAVKVSLLTLPPQGIALKRQILRNLLSAAPESLTCTECGRGGPNRNVGTVHHALRALEMHRRRSTMHKTTLESCTAHEIARP